MIEERLKKLREINGLSQKEFANKTGISFRTVQNYEKDANSVTIRTAHLIAHVFDISAEWLIFGKGAMVKGVEDTLGQNEKVLKFAPIVEDHIEIVKRFDDHEAALDINNDLLVIEKKAKDEFDRLRVYIKATKDSVVARADVKKTEQTTQPWDGKSERRKTPRAS